MTNFLEPNEIIAIAASFALSLVFFLWLTKMFGSQISLTSFDRKWPPITDDEFIARCHSGVNRSVALRTRKIIAKQLGVPYEQVYPEQSFVEDLGC